MAAKDQHDWDEIIEKAKTLIQQGKARTQYDLARLLNVNKNTLNSALNRKGHTNNALFKQMEGSDVSPENSEAEFSDNYINIISSTPANPLCFRQRCGKKDANPPSDERACTSLCVLPKRNAKQKNQLQDDPQMILFVVTSRMIKLFIKKGAL